MIIFKRKIEEYIAQRLWKNRAILLFGPRQAGKTTLAKKLLRESGNEDGYYNCEFAETRQYLVPGRPNLLKELIGDKKMIVLDEAQTIQDIGLVLKTFIDTYPEVQVIAIGSSSFDLANKINEPLTGRAFEFILYPLSLSEIRLAFPEFTKNNLLQYMQFGCYPAVVSAPNQVQIKDDLLKNIATNYLYKDVFIFESIKSPRVFEQLVKLLAFQVGSLVSVNELSISLGISRATVDKYIRLLEQAYIIKVVHSYSRNMRNEIKKSFKIFFTDVGVRNAVIGKIVDVSTREDRGALFENFFIMERFKHHSYLSFAPEICFWRDRYGHEIDCVEVGGDHIDAFECKWNPKETGQFDQFLSLYPNATARTVHPDDLLKPFPTNG